MTRPSPATVQITLDGPTPTQLQNVIHLLKDIRKLNIVSDSQDRGHKSWERVVIKGSGNLFEQLTSLASVLGSSGHPLEAGALLEVHELGTTSTDFGGLGLHEDSQDLPGQDVSELLFLVSAQLEALNSAERAKAPVKPLSSRPPGRRGMTLSEKIFAAHDVDRKGEVKPGDMIRVDVDWIMASELSWKVREFHRP
jgi:hypothetical protein